MFSESMQLVRDIKIPSPDDEDTNLSGAFQYLKQAVDQFGIPGVRDLVVAYVGPPQIWLNKELKFSSHRKDEKRVIPDDRLDINRNTYEMSILINGVMQVHITWGPHDSLTRVRSQFVTVHAARSDLWHLRRDECRLSAIGDRIVLTWDDTVIEVGNECVFVFT